MLFTLYIVILEKGNGQFFCYSCVVIMAVFKLCMYVCSIIYSTDNIIIIIMCMVAVILVFVLKPCMS